MRSFVFSLAIVACIAVAGCSSPPAPLYASYAEAKSQPGPVLEPLEAEGSTLRIKVLDPGDTSAAAQGKHPIVILVYDEAADAPVTAATIQMESRMPAMQHGTSGEENPSHQDFGVYLGTTNHFMPGQWLIRFDTVIDGERLFFEVVFDVGQV